MTPLPHNPAVAVIDLPEDIEGCELRGRTGRNTLLSFYGEADCVKLPPGTYKLICLGNQATEEEAREIVECMNKAVRVYKDYGNPGEVRFKALQSLASLITANGWKNPVFLRKEK